MKNLKYILVLILTITVAAVSASAALNDEPLRGVWVATVYQIDYPQSNTSDAEKLKVWADEVLDRADKMGFNAVFLQVRPSADAFYKSEVFPWSKYISGKQGVAPSGGFDPLEYWITEAHKRGIELHAWINPYRVAVSESDYLAMTDEHPAKQNPSWVVAHTNGQYYFNPGIPEVRNLIERGVSEIVENYDVDGIHMDDYFYPSKDFADSETFIKYSAGFDDIGDWRRNNVDVLIESLHNEVKASGVRFGVSPAGIWANKSNDMPKGSDTNGNQTYFSSYADTRKWVKNEWVDYIVPQIYWEIGHRSADYSTLVNWWAEVVSDTDVDLYIGMADYKAELDDKDSVWYGADELRRQVELNCSTPEVAGEVHFSYSSIVDNEKLCDLYEEIYADKEPEPEVNWLMHNRYIEGINGEFLPEGELTRAQAAMLFARIMEELGKNKFNEAGKYKAGFTDIQGDEWYAAAVGFMRENKIISGYPDGTFKPNRTITRAEFATMISRFDKLMSGGNSFKDVPKSHWAHGAITNAYARGFITGYPDGTFKPDKTITRAETTKILNRLLSRTPDKKAIDGNAEFNVFADVNKKHWAYYEIVEASFSHRYIIENGAEFWDTKNSPYIGENGFVYASSRFEFEIPELKLTGDLTPLNLSKVDSIALHHMEHPNATFFDVERWHVYDNEWRAIGYNFWIGFDGKVYVGRGFNVGAGVGNNNSHVISIGFQGDYHKTGMNMPKEQYEAAILLIEWLCDRVETITVIGGHCAWNNTDCPGSDFPLEDIAEKSGLEFIARAETAQATDIEAEE